jgi:hypothetical protein
VEKQKIHELGSELSIRKSFQPRQRGGSEGVVVQGKQTQGQPAQGIAKTGSDNSLRKSGQIRVWQRSRRY